MPKSFHKYKLLLDENMFQRRSLPLLNKTFDVKHVDSDLNHGGVNDQAVYDLATKTKRIIVTFNVKDFYPLVGTKRDVGIVSIPPAWRSVQIDSKLTALLKKHSPSYFSGRVVGLA